ncbi:MAG: glycosyltransferase family 39 protein [Acetobacteraceae bacterium]|nr:glycosyltransferase family 39 protein [Acetobacteraceae bacterium]
MTRLLAAGLAVLTLIRLWLAAVVPLAPDEAYYWVWSRALAPGYLDHPPMVALWIKAGTALAGPGTLGVRLLGPLSAALGSVLLYDAAERLFPGRHAGLTAAALLNATLLLGVGAVIMTPDTPLLFFWTATLWAGARLALGGSRGWWLGAGLFTGLALTSKYTAVFLPVGLGLFALVAMPRSLRRPEPWLGVALAGLVFLPVVVWNAQNGWVGFARQGGRVANWQPERAVTFLAELVGGQIGLATPGIFILCAAGVVWAARETVRSRDRAWCLLAALSVPPVLVFLQHAIGDRVQGNWPAILYPAACIAAAGLTGLVWRRMVWPSVGMGFVFATVVYAHAVSGWPALAGGRDPAARQLFGWEGLAAQVEAARQAAGADFVAAEPYGLAAELAWASPAGSVVVGAGQHWGPFGLSTAGAGLGRGILIRPERYGGAVDPAEWRGTVVLAGVIRSSGGVEIDRYSVFLGRVPEGSPFAVLLPRR